MINPSQISKKIFLQSFISSVIFLLLLSCFLWCDELGCLACLIINFPLMIWTFFLLILTIKDFIKKKDDKILELIIFGSNALVCLLTPAAANLVDLLRDINLLGRASVGEATVGIILAVIGWVGLLTPMIILLLAIKNKIRSNKL